MLYLKEFIKFPLTAGELIVDIIQEYLQGEQGVNTSFNIMSTTAATVVAPANPAPKIVSTALVAINPPITQEGFQQSLPIVIRDWVKANMSTVDPEENASQTAVLTQVGNAVTGYYGQYQPAIEHLLAEAKTSLQQIPADKALVSGAVVLTTLGLCTTAYHLSKKKLSHGHKGENATKEDSETLSNSSSDGTSSLSSLKKETFSRMPVQLIVQAYVKQHPGLKDPFEYAALASSGSAGLQQYHQKLEEKVLTRLGLFHRQAEELMKLNLYHPEHTMAMGRMPTTDNGLDVYKKALTSLGLENLFHDSLKQTSVDDDNKPRFNTPSI